MKDFLKNNRTTALLLVLAVILLAFSGVRTSRAALTYISDNFTSSVDMPEMGVALVENGIPASGELLANMLTNSGDEFLKPGKAYSEELAVSNTGNMDSFVRVIVNKYWQNPDGTKNTELSPEYIVLTAGAGWIEDTRLSTPERTVLYYSGTLKPGSVTTPFVKTVAADEKLMTYCTSTTSGNVVTTVFDYNGVKLMLNVEAYAVQTHNAEDAVKSAWGVNVAVNNGVLSLK